MSTAPRGSILYRYTPGVGRVAAIDCCGGSVGGTTSTTATAALHSSSLFAAIINRLLCSAVVVRAAILVQCLNVPIFVEQQCQCSGPTYPPISNTFSVIGSFYKLPAIIALGISQPLRRSFVDWLWNYYNLNDPSDNHWHRWHVEPIALLALLPCV